MTGEARFRCLWLEESMRDAAERIRCGIRRDLVKRSGSSEGLWRATRPPPEGSMERGRFGVLQKERDVADAQAAIVQQGTREVTSHLIENMAE